MFLRDIGLEVDRIICEDREDGTQQCTFMFECDNIYEAMVKSDELFASIVEHCERCFSYTEVRIGGPEVEVKPRLFFECIEDILMKYQDDNDKWVVSMVGIQKPYRPGYKMEDVG